MNDIWVAGCPSFMGGADTELLHQIYLWRMNGYIVNIVPNGGPRSVPDNIKPVLKQLHCNTFMHYNGIFRNKTVVNYCNGPALERLEVDSRPAYRFKKYIFFNCMTWVFEKEIEHIRKGNITHLGMISKYQMAYLMKAYYEKLPDIFSTEKFPQVFFYTPYFDITGFNKSNIVKDYIGFGRISRDDPAKFSTDCWKIFNNISSPKPKKVFVLGISDKVLEKIGKPPPEMDFMFWSPGAITIDDFYSRIDVLIHKTGGSRESFGRTILEAMAYGVIPIVERDYAFPEILGGTIYENELDWLMCSTSDEMSYKASHLAFNPELMEHYKVILNEHLKLKFCNKEECINQWNILLQTP